jgi:hypothetical protein
LKTQRVISKVFQVLGNLLQDLAPALQYWSDSLQRSRHCSSPSWGSGGV